MKRKLLQECLTIAHKNNTPTKHPQWNCYKHFSFIIHRNKIVDWGTNRAGSPLTFGYEPYSKIHSEVDAYFRAKGLMRKGELFEVVNIRLTKGFKLKSSSPCKCCWNFLRNLGCKRIWFTTDTGEFANLFF